MILKIFAVRDRATDSFGNPMFLVSQGQAVRSFTDEVNRQAADNQLWAHPDDFDLYYLGDYFTDSGTFNAHTPEMILVGKSAAIRS
jgi:hypothetical protein